MTFILPTYKKNLLVILFVLLIAYSNTSIAATFVVSNVSDFQNALTAAQGNGEADTIKVKSGTYLLDGMSSLTDTLEATITDNFPITIEAEDPNNKPVITSDISIIAWNGQIMHIETGGTDDKVVITVRNIIFRSGGANGGPGYDRGAGLYINVTNAKSVIEGCEFLENRTKREGGGLYFFSDTGSIHILDTVFDGNIVENAGGGAAIHSTTGNVEIERALFKNNLAGKIGGGLTVEITKTGKTSFIRMTNSIFFKNRAPNEGGGGVAFLTNAPYLYITNNSISLNSTPKGVGGGIAIALDANVEVNVFNNIIYGNSGGKGEDLYAFADPNDKFTYLNLYNNILGPDSNFNTAQSPDFYTEGFAFYNHANNITNDPLFVDQTNGDLHLTASSPAIDTGTNTPAGGLPPNDYDLNPRPLDGNGNGSAIADRGAFEYLIDNNNIDNNNDETGYFACFDGVDNDRDGKTDCFDKGCEYYCGCKEEKFCTDGVDNNSDGYTDCEDTDCDFHPSCETGEHSCTDGEDNDGDGLIDCEDEGCNGFAGCVLRKEGICDDREDNDNDGLIDKADPDCNPLCDIEYGDEECGDGIDNDRNGTTDCLDRNCNGFYICEFGREISCNDGKDNDGDTLIDLDDSDCDNSDISSTSQDSEEVNATNRGGGCSLVSLEEKTMTNVIANNILPLLLLTAISILREKSSRPKL